MEETRIERASTRRSHELSVPRTLLDAGRGYLANAGKWFALAMAMSLVVGLVFVLLDVSSFLAATRGRGDVLSFVCNLGALGGIVLAVRLLHRITVLSLAVETFRGTLARGVDLIMPMRPFLTAFLGAVFVVLAVFVALQFLAGVVNSAWVYVVLPLIVLAAFLVVVINTDTKQGIAASISAAWTTVRRELSFGVNCVLVAAVTAALGAWALLAVDLPSVWTETGVHILVRFGITAVAVLGAFFLVLQPLALFGTFSYRAATEALKRDTRDL